jgi:hypothetical protein
MAGLNILASRLLSTENSVAEPSSRALSRNAVPYFALLRFRNTVNGSLAVLPLYVWTLQLGVAVAR